jgi:hypothetical protein
LFANVVMTKNLGFVGGVMILVWGAAPSHGQPAFSNAVNLGTVNINNLSQASGLAASRNNDAVIWTHNDAGDRPRLFALDTHGRHLGTYTLPNSSNVDYEDLALGPGPVTNVQYLYVADIGDNDSSRSSIQIYQIPEPAVYLRQSTNPVSRNFKGVRRINLVYTNGAHNAETFLLDPLTGDVFIGSKEDNRCRLYRATQAQLNAGTNVNLALAQEISFDVAAGGAISPTGREIIVRNERFARMWLRATNQTVPQALAGPAYSVPVVGEPTEPNGEAVGFDPIGRGYFTLSDSASTQPLYYFGRSSPYDLTPPARLVPAGANWRYLDTGTNLGIAWFAPGFNDSAWKTGTAQFGYGDGDEQTLVGFGASSNNKFVTTYFRTTFTLTNLAEVRQLELRLLFNDGAAVYLNGTLVALANLVGGAAFNSLATNTQATLEDTWFTLPVTPTLLRDGTNTLAAEVHQAAANSPDLSFDLQLLATLAPPLVLTSGSFQTATRFQLSLRGPGTNALIQVSSNFVSWTTIGTASLTNGIGAFTDTNATAFSQSFYRAVQ